MELQGGKRVKEHYEIQGVRKFIGTRMRESLRDYPQGSGSVYLCTEQFYALKDELRAQNENVTITSMLTKATAEALKKHPLLNSALVDQKEFFIYDSVNIGVGIGLEEGIMTVVVKEAQDKDIFRISDELRGMIDRLKAKKLQMTDMMGSTFTLSNMGMFCIEQVTPFLNPPETGILAVGATKKQAIVDDADRIVIAPMTCFSLTINHAAVDGLHSGLFMKTLKDVVENPKLHMGL
ncbi:MAG: 2-oxo acid dehydrogenase subunit E2 [Clostridiales Family XIII bacterium]|jgi:pyruvate dehydrogenase E2 component (dihydrolipoamide acetyltransferase)|nr:2-oxo acid dehydrogenase subunit E2 [Clostridiales Family XIII bacterium]